MTTLLLALICGYALGSVPFGLVLARVLGLGDLRKIGSGNIGATNVLRTGHKGAAFATVVLDSGKGAVAVLITLALAGPGLAPGVAGLGAFLGHLYPVWLAFRGGKGVATFLGTLLAIQFLGGLLTCATWLAVALISRTSSLSALVAAAAAPLWLWLTGAGIAVWPALIMTVLIIAKHRANIERIQAGTEPKISFQKR
ncbi:MAG: glycerol-3-phosphate 1-O-acyltransferase PlsY [Pseudomonadota bacterium]